VLDLTRGEALRLGHNYIGTEHLLLALVVEGDGLAGRVLREQGVDTEKLRPTVVRALSAYVAARDS
jgi:ATP-dependent Clp protease ATP-binding subunit ClpC